MPTPIGQVAEFRVYPNRPSRLFFRVRIFRSLSALHAFIRHGPVPRRCTSRCWAMTTGWTRGTSGREIGEILFARRLLGVDIVSHECTHAALAWGRRIHLNPVDHRVNGHRVVVGPEERFCEAQGVLVCQIAQRLWTLGFIQP